MCETHSVGPQQQTEKDTETETTVRITLQQQSYIEFGQSVLILNIIIMNNKNIARGCITLIEIA